MSLNIGKCSLCGYENEKTTTLTCPRADCALMNKAPSLPKLATCEVAAFALGEFFQAVLKTDGIGELRRVYAAFYMQAHGEYPPLPIVTPPKAMVARNGD